MFQIQTLVSRCQDRSAKVPYIICDEAGQENKSLCCGHKGTCLVTKTCEYLCISLVVWKHLKSVYKVAWLIYTYILRNLCLKGGVHWCIGQHLGQHFNQVSVKRLLSVDQVTYDWSLVNCGLKDRHTVGHNSIDSVLATIYVGELSVKYW